MSSSTRIELELLRCTSFQSLKCQFNSIIEQAILRSSSSASSAGVLPPFILLKLKRTIGESFHRWYFDAAGTTTTRTRKRSSTGSVDDENHCKDDDDDPLLLPLDRLFDNEVVSRLVASLVETTAFFAHHHHQHQKNSTKSDVESTRAQQHALVSEAVTRSLRERYANLYLSFSRYRERNQKKKSTLASSSSSSLSSTSPQIVKLEGLEVDSLSSSSGTTSGRTTTTTTTTCWLCVNLDSFPDVLPVFNIISSSEISASICLPIDKDRLTKKLYRNYLKKTNNNNNEAKISSPVVPADKISFPQDFLQSVFLMLLRYSALSDDQLVPCITDAKKSNKNNNNNNDNNNSNNHRFLKRSALSGTGQHSAVPPSVMDVFADTMGVSFECFASPLNVHFERFCSAFADTDAPFGSCGSFFNICSNGVLERLLIAGGDESDNKSNNNNNNRAEEENGTGMSFELNPPFVEDVMEKARQQVEIILSSSSSSSVRHHRPLSFLLVLPHWTSPPTPCISNIRKNENGFLRGEMILAAGEHGYLDGSQHRIGTSGGCSQYKTNHESVVFAMQNDAGAKKWPFTDEVKAKIRKAFEESVAKIPASSAIGALADRRQRE